MPREENIATYKKRRAEAKAAARKQRGFGKPTGLGITVEAPDASGFGKTTVKVDAKGNIHSETRVDFKKQSAELARSRREKQMDALADTYVRHGAAMPTRALRAEMKYNPEIRAALERRRVLRGQNPPSWIEKAIGDVAYMPLGFGMTVAAPVTDVVKRDFSFPRTQEIGKSFYEGTKHAILNPGDDPFLTFLTVWGGIGVVGGTTARLGAAGRAMASDGIMGAVTRKGSEGGSLLHAPHPGTYTLRHGGKEVEVPLSRNPTWRQVQKGKLKATQRGLNKPIPTKQGPLAGLTKEFSPQASFARHRRAAQRIEYDVRRAPYFAAEKDLSYFGKKLRSGSPGLRVNPARNLAGIAVGIFGHEALANPSLVIAKIRAKHAELRQQIDADLYQPNLNQAHVDLLRDQLQRQDEIIAALPAAEAILVEQAPEFLRAVEGARLVSDEGALGLKRVGDLSDEVAEGRLKSMRALFEGAEYRPNTIADRIAEGAVPESFIGRQVIPHDRHNIGTIAGVDMAEGVAWVKFHNKQTNAHGEAYFDLSDMHLRGEKGGEFYLGLDPLPDMPPPDGAFFFPMRAEYVAEHVEPGMGVNFPRIDPMITGKPKPGKFRGTSQRFTGSSLRNGYPALQQALGDRFLRIMRHEDTLDFWDSLYSMASPVKLSERDMPLREKGAALATLRRVLNRAQRRVDIDADELGALTPAEFAELESVFDLSGKVQAGVGESVPGVVWVDSYLIKNIVGLPKDMRWADAINNPARIMTLYLRPAYALNALGNVGMQLVTEGPLAFKWAAQGMHARKLYGPTNYGALKTVAGEGRAIGSSVETGFAHRSSQKLALGWNKFADEWFRVGNVLYHADRKGYRGKEGMDRLFERDELGRYVNQADINEIGNLARKDAVDFNSLTPVERETIRHIIYFYPWVSRGAAWGLRAAKEHPIKTGVAAQFGSIGAQEAERRFGTRIPWWALVSGLTPLGKEKGGRVPTVSVGSVWTPLTTAQAGATVVGLGKGILGIKGGKGIVESLSPAAEAGLTAALGGAERNRPGIPGIVQSLPFYSALQRGGVIPGGPVTFPDRGFWPGVGPLIGGGLWERSTDTDQLARQHAREGSKVERAAYNIRQRRQALVADLKRIGEKETPRMAELWEIQAEIARKIAGKTDAQRLRAVLNVAVRRKLTSRSNANEIIAASKKLTEAKLNSLVESLIGEMGGNDLEGLRAKVTAALDAKGEAKTDYTYVPEPR